MAVFASTAKISGRPLSSLIGTAALPHEKWEEIKLAVRQGGKRIIQLRGRSSFQSPAHHSVLMVKAAIDGEGYPWPCGAYVDSPKVGPAKVLMAMETRLDAQGVHWEMPRGTEAELADLRASQAHLARLRDEVVAMGLLPPLKDWSTVNPNLA
jgi:malate dehydrogenase